MANEFLIVSCESKHLSKAEIAYSHHPVDLTLLGYRSSLPLEAAQSSTLFER